MLLGYLSNFSFLSQLFELQQDICPDAGGVPGPAQAGVAVCCCFLHTHIAL